MSLEKSTEPEKPKRIILPASTPTGEAAAILSHKAHMALFLAGVLSQEPTLGQARYWTSAVPGTDNNWGE